jgi:hypothetical protein
MRMKRRKRLRKKLHRRFLDSVADAISMASEWRAKLFAAVPAMQFVAQKPAADTLLEGCIRQTEAESFEVHASSLPGLPRLIRRLALQYRVTVQCRFTETWASMEVWAAEFPEIKKEAMIYRLRHRADSPVWQRGGVALVSDREAGEVRIVSSLAIPHAPGSPN